MRCMFPMPKLSSVRTIIILLVLLGAIYALVYFYRSGEAAHSRAQEDVRGGSQILEALGKSMVLPAEQPKIATVTDVALLKKKSGFFNKAKKGDAIIMYSDKVIIFDPDTKVIVDVGLYQDSKNTTMP